MVQTTDTQRRIRAARALAGVTVHELAERLGEDGLSARTLGDIERGTRPARSMELIAIAAACGVDPSFFEADLSRPLDAPQGDAVLRKLEQIEARLVILDGKLDGNHDAIDVALRLLGDAADPGGHDASTESARHPTSHDRVQANRPPARRSQ